MDVREKLIEILRKPIFPHELVDPTEAVADYLLDSGVTVQEWMPASDPPKKYRDEYDALITFLVCAEDTNYPFRAMYDGKTWGNGIFYVPAKWWMPLPQPPKGE